MISTFFQMNVMALMLGTDWQAIWTMVLQTALVVAGAFLLTVGIASHLRFRRMVQGERPSDDAAPLHPLERELTRRLAGATPRSDPFSLCMIKFGEVAFSEQMQMSLRQMLRHSDAVFEYQGRAAIILSGDEPELRAALRRLPQELARIAPQLSPEDVLCGRTVFPAAGGGVQALIAKAEPEQPLSAWLAAAPAFEPEAEPEADQDRLYAAAQRMILAGRRSEQPVAVLFIDVDALENFEAYYGVGAAEFVQQKMADAAARAFRVSDLVGRYEQTCLAVLQADPAGAEKAAHRLIRQVKMTDLQFESYRFRPALRIGIASCPDHGYLPRQILVRAYQALQEAQERGGNVAITFDESMERHEEQALVVDAL